MAFLFLSGRNSEAQNFDQIGISDGLLSNVIYSMVKDSDGIIWLATDHGISRFNGKEISNYTIEEGLPDNSILRLYEDKKGRVWFSAYTNEIGYFEDGILHTYPHNGKLKSLFSFHEYISNVLYISEDQTIVFSNNGNSFHCTANNVLPLKKPLSKENFNLHFKIDSSGFRLSLLENPAEDLYTRLKVFEEDGGYYFQLSHPGYPNRSMRQHVAIVDDQNFCLSFEKKLIQCVNGKFSERLFEHEILAICYDNYGNLLLGFYNGGIHLYRRGRLSHSISYLDGYAVTGIVQDRELNYWISTLNNGLIRKSDINFPLIQNPGLLNKEITDLEKSGNDLFILTEESDLFKIQGKQITGIDLQGGLIPIENFPIRRIIANDLNSEVFLLGNRVAFYFNNHLLSKVADTISSYLHDGVFRNDLFYYSDLYGYNKYYQDGERFYSSKNGFQKRVRKIFIDRNRQIWLSNRHDGVFVVQNDTVKRPDFEPDFFRNHVQSFCEGDLYMVFGSSSYGLLIREKSGRSYVISRKDGLNSNVIDAVCICNDSVILAGSNRGINRIKIRQTDSIPDIHIVSFGTLNGLPDQAINDIVSMHDIAWIATDKGLCHFDPNYCFINQDDFHISKIDVQINNRDTLFQKDYDLNKNQNSLNFKLETFSFNNDIEYEYKLLDGESWTPANGNVLSFPNLKHGKYHLSIRAFDDYGFVSEFPDGIAFNIQKSFYNTIWFFLIVISLVVFLLFWLFRRILHSVKKQEDLKKNMLLAEKKALLTQMNPHFIFNSLNSIQHYIVEQDEELAANYLSSFSELIRKVLENSKKNYISIDQEIDYIKNYLDLEKLRFEDKFTYQINIDEAIDINETYIPPMMIQPLVENAIWHGILPLNKSGEIFIEFKFKSEYELVCSIEDNGIGRKKAQSHKQNHGKESTSLKNIEERLDLLSKLHKKQYYIKIIDLGSEDKAKGTRLEICIPMNL